jgi:hypothetical protein
MPPWKLTNTDFPVKHDRRLSTAEIEVLKQWTEGGTPEGDPKLTPPLPPPPAEWPLGKPDMIVKMPEAFPVPAEGKDIYRNFVIPMDLPEERWIQAIDFHPGARSVVHHALFYFDTTGAGRAQDAQDDLPGYSGGMSFRPRAQGRNESPVSLNFGGDSAIESPYGGLGGWAVGGNPRVLPEGLAMRLPKGSDFILSTHFQSSGKEEKEVSTVGLYFAKAKPTNHFIGIMLPPVFGALKGLDIPPGEKEYTITDSFTLPVEVKAFSVGAHAHYLAKTFTFIATLPNGEQKVLAEIADWDFAWQERYYYESDVVLPAGTKLDVKITYDNSADNPRNPSQPPRRVKWGEQSFDEMGSIALLVVPSDQSELPKLREVYRAHVREAFAARLRNPLGRIGNLLRSGEK